MISRMKFKSNILIITLFLLMMSSLSALLVTAYINNLIKLSSSFHDYYKSYYIANAWLELALVKTNGKVRKYGFEDTVSSWSTTVTNNFSGSFTSSIYASSTNLWDANTSNPLYSSECNAATVSTMWYMIPPWWCVPIILLKDSDWITPSSPEWSLSAITDNDLTPVWSSHYPSISVFSTVWFTALLTAVWSDLGFLDWRSTWFVAGQNNNVIHSMIADTTSPYFTDGWKYILMIANTSSNTWYYCLQSNVAIPTQYVTISAQWHYRNTILDLKWVRKAWLPADFCYTAISS